MLTDRLHTEFNQQIANEFYAAHLYLSMSAFFSEQNLAGFAHWVKIQYQEETTHAHKLMNFILDRGRGVKLGATKEPTHTWASPLAVFQDILTHEREVTGQYNDLMELARSERDHASQSFLQWFVTEQVEEEANVSKVLQQLKMIGDSKSALFFLDKELSARVFVPVAGNVQVAP